MVFAVPLHNRTPFRLATHVQVDAEGQERLVIMLSASFTSGDDGQFAPADEQVPVMLRDVPFGDPALSSTRYEADIAPEKPACEVIVNGSAHAPEGKPTQRMQVGLSIGSVRKVLAVIGDRVREGAGLSAPQPFTVMPIRYERAYGGTLPDGQLDLRNPVGVGYRGAASADPTVRTHAPNISYPSDANDKPSCELRPAGFGAIGRGWEPRLRLTGTYDQAWQDAQWPLPPKDFDPRAHLATAEDQQLPRLDGGEDATVIGMTPSGRWDFRIPRVTAPLLLIFDDRIESRRFTADTVVIETDLLRVTLKARLRFTTRRNAPMLRDAVFGHVTPAFVSARRKRKTYLDLRGGDGTLAGKSAWQY